MADDMDIALMADLDLLPSSSTTSTNSTSSKPLRFHPKPRGATTAPSATAKTPSKPKIEPNDPMPTPHFPMSSSPDTNPKMKPDTDPKIEVHVEEEDEVEREIDVFLSPFSLDENETEIYVMQYPLRPNWQTYEMERRCKEVRMMPKCRNMEVDIRIDDDQQTFDADIARLSGKEKQTLRSLVAPSATNYAVGILRKDQIHLNQINGVVQLRPVIMSNNQKRKRNAQQMDPEKNVHDSTPSIKMAKTEPGDSGQTEDDDESWVPLEFLPESSILSNEYYKKMVTTDDRKIEFRMTQSDYMGALCPGESISRKEKKEAIIRELRKLPLEERLKKWFTEVTQLNRFDFIEYLLAPVEPVEVVLQQVQMLADLIRGVWVTKTSILYEGYEYEAMVRDYILLQFTKGDSIPYKKLIADLGQDVRDNSVLMRPHLANLIIRKPGKVKFKGSPDPTFRKRHHDVVKGQVAAWSAREESIIERVREFNKIGVSWTKKVVVMVEDGGPAMSASKSISVPETRMHLIEALTKIFNEQKVRTISSVVRDLCELAKQLSALPKNSDKNKHLINGALSGAYAAQTELKSVVSVVAACIFGNVFVMKAPKIEHLRNVFIKLFRDAKKPKAVLRKQDIMQLGEKLFKREINESEFTQVVDDICTTTEDGGLMLRTGD